MTDVAAIKKVVPLDFETTKSCPACGRGRVQIKYNAVTAPITFDCLCSECGYAWSAKIKS